MLGGRVVIGLLLLTYIWLQPQPTWQKAAISLACSLRCSAEVKAPLHLPGRATSLAPCAAHLQPKLP